MTNWKTTVTAIVTAVAGFVLFSPQYFPPWAIDVAKYVMLGGLAAFGLTAKDSNAHSTAAEVQTATIEAADKAAK
jgi:hypothetical protein